MCCTSAQLLLYQADGIYSTDDGTHCLAVCVCVSVCEHSQSQTVLLMTFIFGIGVYLDLSQAGILDQGRRSKIKVIR